jgi:hypothetical protein
MKLQAYVSMRRSSSCRKRRSSSCGKAVNQACVSCASSDTSKLFCIMLRLNCPDAHPPAGFRPLLRLNAGAPRVQFPVVLGQQNPCTWHPPGRDHTTPSLRRTYRRTAVSDRSRSCRERSLAGVHRPASRSSDRPDAVLWRDASGGGGKSSRVADPSARTRLEWGVASVGSGE